MLFFPECIHADCRYPPQKKVWDPVGQRWVLDEVVVDAQMGEAVCKLMAIKTKTLIRFVTPQSIPP